MTPLQVFLATRRGDEADLRMFAHDLPVKIKTRLRILLQRAVTDELLKIFPALRIDFRRVRIRARRQINFRFADVQKTERVAGGDFARFVRRHHVVGQFADLRGQFGFGPQRGKRFDRAIKRREDTNGAGQRHAEIESE